jgi:hypothetical protein
MSIKLANFFRFITGSPKITHRSVSYTVQINGKAVKTVTFHYEAE